jgi:hypothetical protein
MSTPAPLPSRQSSVSELLEHSSQLFKRALPACLPLAMIAMLMALLPNLYWQLSGRGPMRELPRDPVYWLLYALGVAAYLWLLGALLLRLRSLHAGGARSLPEELRAAAALWPSLLVASLLAAVLVFAGTLLLISAVVVYESSPPLAALRRSFTLVRGLWLKFFACVLIGALIAIICIFTAGLVASLLIAIFTAAGTAAATALSTAAMLLVLAAALVFFTALSLTIYSAASSSA